MDTISGILPAHSAIAVVELAVPCSRRVPSRPLVVYLHTPFAVTEKTAMPVLARTRAPKILLLVCQLKWAKIESQLEKYIIESS